MVLFAKSALTRAVLAQKRQFSYMIKELPKTPTKVPFPSHVKGSSQRTKKELSLLLNKWFRISIKGVAMWKNLFFLAGIPAIALVNVNCFYFEEQHPARPEFKPYEHMRKRSKVRHFHSNTFCWYVSI